MTYIIFPNFQIYSASLNIIIIIMLTSETIFQKYIIICIDDMQISNEVKNHVPDFWRNTKLQFLV